MKNLLKKLSSDVAGATLVMGVISMFFVCTCLGFGLDLSKNAYLKNVQNSISQEAVEKSVKAVGSDGSLAVYTVDPNHQVPDAVYAFANYYNTQSRSSEQTVFKNNACAEGDVVLQQGAAPVHVTYPYTIVTLDTKRTVGNSSSAVSYLLQGTDAPKLVSGNPASGTKYQVIAADVHDAVRNFLLSMVGMSCQNLNSKVSAIAFGSQSDLQ